MSLRPPLQYGYRVCDYTHYKVMADSIGCWDVFIIVKSVVSQMNCSNIEVTVKNFIVNNVNAKLHNVCV